MPKLVNKTDENGNMVRQLSGLGIPHNQICAILNISKPTLYKYYESELLDGKAKANAKVAQNLFNIACGTGKGAVTAGIFWLKTQCNWSEKTIVEVQDGTEQDYKFKQLITDIQRAKLAEENSDNTIN